MFIALINKPALMLSTLNHMFDAEIPSKSPYKFDLNQVNQCKSW
jgi:hypothetical protein